MQVWMLSKELEQDVVPRLRLLAHELTFILGMQQNKQAETLFVHQTIVWEGFNAHLPTPPFAPATRIDLYSLSSSVSSFCVVSSLSSFLMFLSSLDSSDSSVSMLDPGRATKQHTRLVVNTGLWALTWVFIADNCLVCLCTDTCGTCAWDRGPRREIVALSPLEVT